MLLKGIREYGGIYLAIGATDLRKAIDGLAQIVKQEFEMDPFGNSLYLFCNKRRKIIKGLAWDRNGFSLYYKRLDGMGARFVWPGSAESIRNISVGQLELLMNGMSVDPPRGFGNITAREF